MEKKYNCTEYPTGYWFIVTSSEAQILKAIDVSFNSLSNEFLL